MHSDRTFASMKALIPASCTRQIASAITTKANNRGLRPFIPVPPSIQRLHCGHEVMTAIRNEFADAP